MRVRAELGRYDQLPVERYDPQAIEAKWQSVWADERAFEVPNPEHPVAGGAEKSTYVLEMLPYPSGDLHMGHVFNYTLGDVFTHIRRRQGYTVLRPMGYDAFGLPAENAAIREGGHPRAITQRNIDAIRRQMRRMGWAIDWSREVSTCEPDYYRWTQWLFLRFFEAGLAYRREAPVKWCPNDQTVLANEQVIDGRCERCGAEVIAKNLEQWFFRITDYADRLLDEMALLESWPERVLTMQRNWIGRSEGAEVVFRVDGARGRRCPSSRRARTRCSGRRSSCSRPSTRSSASSSGDAEREREVLDYVAHAAALSAVERADADKPEDRRLHRPHDRRPGERRGSCPIWVADYVLMEYGTGAIMAVPGPRRARLRVRARSSASRCDRSSSRRTARPSSCPTSRRARRRAPSTRAAVSGLPDARGDRRHRRLARAGGAGRAAIGYRLRDWLLSRQRYWGCPIPIVYCDACGMVPVPDDELPVLLPEVTEYVPKGRSPLAAAEDGCARRVPRCGGAARRETDTMDTFVDSSWYYMRYADAQNDDAPFDRELVDHWLPVRPVHRRHRARDPPPALLALLHEGAERPRARRLPRAVPAALHAGDDPLPRREDVQVEGQRGRAGRDGRRIRRRRRAALHPVHGPGRAGQGVARQRHRGHVAPARPDLAAGSRGRGARRGRRSRWRRARPRGAPDDRAGHATTSCGASSSTRRSRPCSSS